MKNATKFLNKIFLAFFAVSLSVLILGCGEKVEITKISDLENITVGCQAGTTGEAFLHENLESAKAKPFRDGYEACLALKNKELDAVILDEFPARTLAKDNSDLKIIDLNLPFEEYAVAVKKGNTELLQAINRAIRILKNDGSIEKLEEAFFPADGNIKIPQSSGAKYAKTLKMGTNAAFPPFEYTEGTKVIGFDVSFAELIADKSRRNLHVFDVSFVSLLDALNAGSIDFICAGLTINEERKLQMDFSEPYFTSRQVIIVRK